MILNIQALLKEFRTSLQSNIDKTLEQVEENKKIPEQLYYVKLPSSFDEDLGDRYLNLDVNENKFFLNDSENNLFYKTKFNNSELDNIQKQLPFLNIGMLKVSVEDDK